jgi:hypothetical protein
MKSLLAKVTKSDVVAEPFPHIVIKDALDDATSLKLIEEYPSLETVARGGDIASNKRLNYPAKDVLADPEISETWKEMVKAHTSPEFFKEMVNLFDDHIRAAYPNFEQEFKPLDELKAGTMFIDKYPDVDVLLNAQIAMNTPVVGAPSSVRRAHLDARTKLFAGLFYLRRPEDDSTGGDLELYKFKGDTPYGFRERYIDNKYIDVVRTVKYERNVLVLFLNSEYALHGVTPRSVTNVPRCFLNLVAEVSKPLFDVTEYQERQSFFSSPADSLKKLKKSLISSKK